MLVVVEEDKTAIVTQEMLMVSKGEILNFSLLQHLILQHLLFVVLVAAVVVDIKMI